jgi:uncharacterized membrane protein
MQPGTRRDRRVPYADASAGAFPGPNAGFSTGADEGTSVMAETKKATQNRPSLWRRLRSIHPALVLASLDLVGLAIASYLSFEELVPGGEVSCTIGGFGVSGCKEVAASSYARPFAGIPVAVYGVFLSLTLFVLAIAWWRTGTYKLLLAHYALSLVGVVFEGWFQFAQVFLIHAVCIWCESYGISLILRFVIALWVFLRTPKPEDLDFDEAV